MLTGIDHIVIVVSDLDVAMQNYRQLGFSVFAGGRNPSGTHNALIALADGSYIELSAFREPKPAHPWWTKLEQGGGLIDFCLQTDDLHADIAVFRDSGIDMSDPIPMTRVRPDGYEIKWLLSIPHHSDENVVPFLIKDVTPREERVPHAICHPNQAAGLGTATAAVGKLGPVRRCFGGLLQQEGEEMRREDLDAAGLRFAIGPHVFECLVPIHSDGPLQDWLAARGPSLYAATISSAAGQSGPLDEVMTQRAKLSWQ